jgi:hypothetical protein
MGNNQPALRALFACESGLSEPEIGLEHPVRPVMQLSMFSYGGGGGGGGGASNPGDFDYTMKPQWDEFDHASIISIEKSFGCLFISKTCIFH